MKEQILMDNMSEVNDSVGEGQVVVSVRMPSALRDFARDQAKAERRTVSSWIASLVGMAYDTARGEREATMREVMGKLELIHALLVVKGGKAPKSESKDNGPSPYDIDTGVIVTKETWHCWLNHLRSMGTRLNHYSAMKHFEQISEIYDRPEQWNCDVLVRELIKQAARSIYLPNSFKKS
jgi:hypothetical protein